MSRQRQPFGELPRDVLRQPRDLGGPIRRGIGQATAGMSGVQPFTPLRASIAFFTYQTDVASKAFLQANPNRVYLAMQNNSISDLWLNLSSAAGASQGIKLPASGFIEWFTVIPTGSVNVWGAAAGLSFTLAEG